MGDLVNLTIDDVKISVPKGTVVVDAAKQIDNNIPVFCYHPKMKPVGMCRMCLVEIGMPVRDRESGQIVVDGEGNPKVNFRGLQTGCTVEVAEGMVVRTTTNFVTEARDDILEFLLTSHPLDCPICDKGGECPLQNLTLRHGPGVSRFDYLDKIKLAKHVPLGDLIFLDRERCIQCARCTRFQSEIVDDPVIDFHNRGRRLEIVTLSEPGFDSYWSGNTTDICPVGALTTSDFRFGARPWELTPVASICPHCPVGCNTTMSTRREAMSGGRTVIKRIMPRQNEYVNEVWICDKGRFVHHFADSTSRLTKPLIRENGQLVESSWDEALDIVAGRLQMARNPAGLANDRLSNEDLFAFQKLFRQGLESKDIDLARSTMAGGDVVAEVGLANGSKLQQLGQGDAVLVVASDLHEEAPIWWLQVKQAAERGASLVVLNLRATRLDKYASHVIHYELGEALTTAHHLLNSAKVETDTGDSDPLQAAADALIDAENLVIFYGSEGLSYSETDALARLLGNFLLVKQMDGEAANYHAGRPNNGLIPVWPRANTQGAWDMGLRPDLEPGYAKPEEPGMDVKAILSAAATGDVDALYLLGSDPVGEGLLEGRGEVEFLVVQELFMTETAQVADVVLPAQSWAEREGTFTNGERRVQRFYPAIPGIGECRPDWLIVSQIGERVGLGKPPFAASLLFREIAQAVPQYAELDYRVLARTEKQWPDVGGDDLYYGGNAYQNTAGLGRQWEARAESEEVQGYALPDSQGSGPEGLNLINTRALYSRGTILDQSALLTGRVAGPTAQFHRDDASELAVADGDMVAIQVNGIELQVQARVDGQAPAGVILLRGIGLNTESSGSGSSEVESVRVMESDA
jgi:NADH-quinone oxidoreductase subunit G